MSEKFTINGSNFWGNAEAIPQMVLFHMMSASGTYSDKWPEKFGITNDFFPFDVEVSIKIGPTEVSFKEFVEHYAKTYDKQAENKAKEIIQEKFNNLENQLAEFKEKMINELTALGA